MKFNRYEKDMRWERCSDVHKHHGICPNWFMTALIELDHPRLRDINVAVETGTFEGHTTEFFAESFERVFTVEKYIEDNYYTNKNLIEVYADMKKRYKNISFFNGDSPVFLESVLKTLDEPCVILLDAHNGASSPVEQEILAIKKSLKQIDSIILIDDVADAGTGNWPSMQRIEQLLLDINPNFKFKVFNFGRQIFTCYE